MNAVEKLNAYAAGKVAIYRKAVAEAASGAEVDPAEMMALAIDAGRTPAQLASDLELCSQRAESKAAFEAEAPGTTIEQFDAEYKVLSSEQQRLEAEFTDLRKTLHDTQEAMRRNRSLRSSREQQSKEQSKEHNELMRSTGQPGTDYHDVANFVLS
jgi:uncharacterized protein YukE